jgi:3-oxoacyl-[acyl-carrier-protein] synthase-1
MLRLATPALEQLQGNFTEPVPLLLCGPEKMPGRRSIISDAFIKHLAIQTKVAFDIDNSYAFPEGRAAGFYALEVAMQLLESGKHNEVMIGGVDSFLDLYLLATMDSEDRILAPGMMNAFAPGEAAVFIVVKLADEKSAIKIFPPGIADEPGHRYSSEPYKGEGLANAVTESISKAPDNPIKTVFASFNGENFNAKEWGVAAIRNQQHFDSEFNMVHPADCYGDIGAATGPMLMALAALGLLQGHYQGPALVWASSEIQQRAAAYIET